MTRPASFPLALYHGDSYSWRFVVWQDEAKTIPADLTGVVPKAQIRETPGSTSGVKLDMVCTVTAPNFVDVKLNAPDWASFGILVAYWDLQLTYPDARVFTLVAGKVTITQDVTI